MRLEDGRARALVYPELGFQLFGYEVEVAGRSVEVISAPAEVREPPDRRYGNPVLFPAAGVSNGSAPDCWDHAGRALLMPQHGWARNCPFEVERADARSVSAVLRPAASTGMRLAFPFDLELRLEYALEDGALVLRAEVNNRAAEPFPYALGFHPYVCAPLTPGGRHDRCHIRLPGGVRASSGDGWRTIARAPAPARTVTAELPELAGSIVLQDTGATSLEVADLDAGLGARVSVAGSEESFPVWVVWSAAPDAPYVCPEPWTDLPNALNRPGTRTLAPGATHRYRMSLSLHPL
jgi:galactose mutarotase-like enzyme